MSVELEALRVFRAKGSADMRRKYPSIYREHIDKNAHFNPNINYLYAPSVEDLKSINKQISPWHCFTLIPEVSNYTYKWQKEHIPIHRYYSQPINHQRLLHNKSLYATLYLLNFLNWAIYYYKTLVSNYNNFPKGRPKKQDKVEMQE